MNMVDVAQLVRALDCGSRGWGFKSPRPPQMTTNLYIVRSSVFSNLVASLKNQDNSQRIPTEFPEEPSGFATKLL